MAIQDDAPASREPRSSRKKKAAAAPAANERGETEREEWSPPAAAQVIESIPVALLDENPANPRRVFPDIDGLAADLRVRGILQPLLVRPREGKQTGRFEIVFGARRFRASKLAELETVPAIVRDYSDAEALEIAIVENSQRSDVHPLEEADGYRTLRETHGYTVEEIAAKVGKGHSHVYGRLKFCTLAKDARDAFLEGKLTAATALLIARIPHKDLQAKALKRLTDDGYRGDPPGLREAQQIVRDHFMLRLADAPFDRGDASLVKGAPPCLTCPKRTGNQRELFADVEAKDDLCTDPKCFDDKRDAAWEKKKVEAKEKGLKVLSQKESARLFPYSGSHLTHNAEYVDLGEKHYDYKTGKSTPIKKLVGAAKVPVVLARDPEGKVRELAPRAAVNKLLPKETRAKGATSGGSSDAAKKERERAKKAKEKKLEVLLELVGYAEASEPGDEGWRALGRAMVRAALSDSRIDVCMRRGVEIPKGKRHEAEKLLLAHVKTLSGPEARGLCFELATHGRSYSSVEDASAKELLAALSPDRIPATVGKVHVTRIRGGAPKAKGGRK